MNVLVTCGASIIMGEVVALLRQIQSIKSILLVDAERIYFDHGCQTVLVPFGGAPEYSAVIHELIKTHSIDFIFVGSDEEALALCRYDWLQSRSHLDSLHNIELVLDKFKLHTDLSARQKEHKLVPDFKFCKSHRDLHKMIDQHDSIIARPVQGRGSKQLQHIISPDMQAKFPEGISVDNIKMSPNHNEIFYAEYLPGDKFSADCIFVDGELITCMLRNNGPEVKYRSPTIKARTSEDFDVFLFATKIGRVLSLSGFHQIECGKTSLGEIRLIEINPRLDATLPITKCYSHNFYELLLQRIPMGLMRPKYQYFHRYLVGHSL